MPIDAVGFDFEVVAPGSEEAVAAIRAPPAEGVYVHGLFLEGAGWDAAAGRLAESAPKVGLWVWGLGV